MHDVATVRTSANECTRPLQVSTFMTSNNVYRCGSTSIRISALGVGTFYLPYCESQHRLRTRGAYPTQTRNLTWVFSSSQVHPPRSSCQRETCTTRWLLALHELDIEPVYDVMVFDLFVEQAQELPVSDKFFLGNGRESTSETRETMVTEKVFEKARGNERSADDICLSASGP